MKSNIAAAITLIFITCSCGQFDRVEQRNDFVHFWDSANRGKTEIVSFNDSTFEGNYIQQDFIVYFYDDEGYQTREEYSLLLTVVARDEKDLKVLTQKPILHIIKESVHNGFRIDFATERTSEWVYGYLAYIVSLHKTDRSYTEDFHKDVRELMTYYINEDLNELLAGKVSKDPIADVLIRYWGEKIE